MGWVLSGRIWGDLDFFFATALFDIENRKIEVAYSCPLPWEYDRNRVTV